MRVHSDEGFFTVRRIREGEKVHVRRPSNRHNEQTNKANIMKTSNYLLASVAIVALGTALLAKASEPVLSPRAKSNQIRAVSGTSANQVNLAANRPIGNAKAWALAQDFRTVPSTGSSIDLARAQRPSLSPKDSRYEAAWRANAEHEFQIAPVK